MLDVTDRLVVIIGGGAVASRKAKGVLEAGATRVKMVAPSFAPDVPERVERIVATYDPSHLAGAGLVFASTDSAEVNDAVLRHARAKGVLACRADMDDEEPGDFVTPAKLVRGSVVVTVSAGSPALAAVIRDGLSDRFDSAWTQMAEQMQTLRPLIRASGLDQKRRAAVFRSLASAEAFAVLADGGAEGLRVWLKQRFSELSHG
jgi:siroheme synthase-like protein